MAEKEYIEREEAIAEVTMMAEDRRIPVDSYGGEVVGEVIRLLRGIPAADARPVVLCRECKHFQVNISPSGYLPQGVPEWECRYWLRPTGPTDFCSYGEKREES